MPFDDQRGRTGNFSDTLIMAPTMIPPNGAPGTGTGMTGTIPDAVRPPTPGFLGGEAGGFLQGGGNGGGFTNFSQYLYANPGGAGMQDASSPTAPGMSGIDKAMNAVYGIPSYNPPPAPDAGDGSPGATGTGATGTGTATPGPTLGTGTPGTGPAVGWTGLGGGGTGRTDVGDGEEKHAR